MTKINQTPASLGYQMPAEWETHESTWLSWPANTETWPGPRLKRVQDVYLQMLEGLLPGEKVNLLVRNPSAGNEIKKRLEKMSIRTENLILHSAPTVDAWIRDYGPTFLKKRVEGRGEKGDRINGAKHREDQPAKAAKVPGTFGANVSCPPSPVSENKAYVKWIFNAWGGKYESLKKDTEVFEGDLIPYPRFKPGIILEGGSIEVNGAGTCLTTEQCLLNKNRNPKLSRKDLEQYLKDYLGVSNIVWLKEGIAGDDTDGHVDDIARFVNAQTLLSVFEEEESDENYEILKQNWEDLKNSRDQNGKKWNLVKLPTPGVVAGETSRLPASYANFLISNKSVLLPVFGHSNDRKASQILQEFFPKLEIIPIPCQDLVYGLGAIHCVSQQEPA